MKNISIWQDIDINIVDSLKKDIDVDVLIVGAGITGLSTAYKLINSNLKICVVDRNVIGKSITTKSTGKITFMQDILTKIDDKNIDKYLKSQIEAYNIIEKIIKENNIECDYEKVTNYLFTNDDIKKLDNLEKKLIKQIKVIKKDNYLQSEGATFNPAKYLINLKKICLQHNIDIYENTCIIKIDKKDNTLYAYTPQNKIKAKYIVLVPHYPVFLTPLFLPMKSYLEKSYLYAQKVDDIKHTSGINIDKKVESFRYYKDYYIYLTETSKITEKLNSKKCFENLLKNTDKVDYIWSNKDIMTIDNMPYIGFIKENILIATGYNTWGMTNGTIAAKIISDLINKKNNEYEELFNPNRNVKITNYLKYPINMLNNVKAFANTKINKNKPWYKNVRFEERNGKNVAIYIDENNVEHIVYNKCPHLKCSLIFNEIEKIWECPCHGSKFDIDGKCIEGPSNYDIIYKDSSN